MTKLSNKINSLITNNEEQIREKLIKISMSKEGCEMAEDQRKFETSQMGRERLERRIKMYKDLEKDANGNVNLKDISVEKMSAILTEYNCIDVDDVKYKSLEKNYIAEQIAEYYGKVINDPSKRVIFFTDQDLEGLKLELRDDGLIYNNGKKANYNNEIYSYTDEGIFVSKKLKGVGGEIHHSSLSRGAKVLCAGRISIEDGKVTMLSNESGHFKPRKIHLDNMTGVLEKYQSHDFEANYMGNEDNIKKKVVASKISLYEEDEKGVYFVPSQNNASKHAEEDIQERQGAEGSWLSFSSAKRPPDLKPDEIEIKSKRRKLPLDLQSKPSSPKPKSAENSFAQGIEDTQATI